LAKKPRINNEIRAAEVRLIDEEGKNLGVLKTFQALEMAKEKGLDLIEISPNISPPIAKIMDFGKFLYKEKRKARDASRHSREKTEMKNIRIHLGTSEHDLSLKARKASDFLKEGHRLKLELFLKGREKYLDRDFLKTRLERIINLIPEQYKILQDVKKGPRGISIIIEKTK
jgi:translation initiation factor IF-3